ncbi:MAG: hypothetical protein ACE5JG_02765 [Planctomycetota bacterium]
MVLSYPQKVGVLVLLAGCGLLALLSQWGGAGGCDFDGGGVGITDLLKLLGNWAGCP